MADESGEEESWFSVWEEMKQAHGRACCMEACIALSAVGLEEVVAKDENSIGVTYVSAFRTLFGVAFSWLPAVISGPLCGEIGNCCSVGMLEG